MLKLIVLLCSVVFCCVLQVLQLSGTGKELANILPVRGADWEGGAGANLSDLMNSTPCNASNSDRFDDTPTGARSQSRTSAKPCVLESDSVSDSVS